MYQGSIQAYLTSTESLPLLGDGTLNMSPIAIAAEISMQLLYKKPSIRDMLADAKTEKDSPIQQNNIRSH